MKSECPYCYATQNVLDDLVALPLPCRKCGQTFVPAEAIDSVDPIDLPSPHSPAAQISDEDWISDAECVSAGIRRVANSYFSLVVTAVMLLAVFAVAQFNQKVLRAPVVLIFVSGGLIVFLISLFLWFNGQVQLKKGHPVGSGLHEAIARSLNMSVMAIVARVFARILTMPILKGLGGILSMAAFDRMLLYFELLCIELNEEVLRRRVQSLSKFYRRTFSVFIGFLLLYAFVGIPLGVPPAIIFVGLGFFALALILFSIWFGAMLQAVRTVVETRLDT